jgi:predicted enzyme related to lactoylglutathione lyase
MMNEIVSGIGGISIYSSNARRLAEWYHTHFGIECEYNEIEDAYYHEFYQRDYNESSKITRLIWAIRQQSEGSSQSRQFFMVSYRVEDLDQFLSRVKSSGVAVLKVEDRQYARLAWIEDLDGNRLELFQDKALLSPPEDIAPSY